MPLGVIPVLFSNSTKGVMALYAFFFMMLHISITGLYFVNKIL